MTLILLYFFFLALLLWVASFREGFDTGAIGEYAYLKPHENTVLDATTESEFSNAFNNTTSFNPNANVTTNKNNLSFLKNNATLEEFQYYIKYNKWPYGSYITNYITNNKDAILKSLELQSIEEVQKLFPTRGVYYFAIDSIESKQSPLPLSNDIYTGKAPPESVSPIPSTTTSSLSPDNFTKLKAICSSIA